MSETVGARDNVVEIRGLSRRFGRHEALRDVSLALPPGTVLGVLGANGAGKSTLIRHVLGLLRAQEGTVRVFGRDPAQDPVGVLGRIGYLSEDVDLPEWMRVDELMRYCRALYPRWDDRYAERLRDDFGLSRRSLIRTLSRGQRARAGLLAALAHRPPLLVLDEPSSGLDPVVRRDILSAIIQGVAEDGRTVLFSSHLLDEVERVADRIAMIAAGRLVLDGALDDVKAAHRIVTFRCADPRSGPPELPGAHRWEGEGRDWSALYADDGFETDAALLGARVSRQRPATLDEIFVARACVEGPYSNPTGREGTCALQPTR